MTGYGQFLRNIGMVTKVAKTGLIFFSRKPIDDITPITVNGEKVTPKHYNESTGHTISKQPTMGQTHGEIQK